MSRLVSWIDSQVAGTIVLTGTAFVKREPI